MEYIPHILFAALLAFGIGLFIKNISKIIRNIKLGKPVNRSDNPSERWKTTAMVAMGQSKMAARPIPFILHLFVYVGFVIINLEVLEIIIDGLFGTHRVFSFMGSFYNFLIGSFEILAFLVLIAVIIFYARRNFVKIARFWKPEMKGWPKRDADNILYIESILMLAFLLMNGADYALQAAGVQPQAGAFPISSWFTAPLFNCLSNELTHIIGEATWWFHIAGILFFLNYLYFSKHLHILLAFPNVYFSKLEPKGQFTNDEAITKEVKSMMDPNADPYAAAPEGADTTVQTFGAKDIFDLNQVQLLNAYSCTECGRCTSECPANLTGKKLSPRKIMMDTRDRLEEVGKNIDTNKTYQDDGKTLHDRISAEELWACTTCNACTQACPLNIDPLSIIVEMRRYLVMEQSAAPQELNLMMSNVENNGAPWPFSTADRLKWKDEL